MEIVHPDGTRFTHPMPLGYKERLHKLELELTEKCTADGAWVEPKGITHWALGWIGQGKIFQNQF